MAHTPFEIPGPTSPFAVNLDQRYLIVPEFTLESGHQLTNAPVAFQTWGKLNAEGTNVILVCHAISGNALANVWWDTMVGPGHVIDTNKYFVVCCNALGSPYGTASPVTRRGGEELHDGQWKEPPFQIVMVVGGSMGGMLSLEWPLCYPVRNSTSPNALPEAKPGEQKYIRSVVLLASPARHSAWAIAWSEIQRMTIMADSRYKNGKYLLSAAPLDGLSAARMCAMITYRYHKSLERRFSRMRGKQNLKASQAQPSQPSRPVGVEVVEKSTPPPAELASISDPQDREMYAMQSYLHYHGRKFVDRFDPNCYIHLTHKLDAHDAARDRHSWAPHVDKANTDAVLRHVLRHLGTSPIGCEVLSFSITTDELYPTPDQQFICESIPGSQLFVVNSEEGHDAFLLEFTQIERVMRAFMKKLTTEAKL